MDINIINGSSVAIIDSLIPEEDCKKLADYAIYVKENNIEIENIAGLDEEAESSANIKYWQEKNLYLNFCPPEYIEVAALLGERFKEAFSKYLSAIGSLSGLFDTEEIKPTVVHVYRKGDFLDRHHDGKDFALVFYLNEPDEFTGGDLLYNDLDIRITPKRGRLVISPSKEIHQVLEVTSGFRCAITVFIGVTS